MAVIRDPKQAPMFPPKSDWKAPTEMPDLRGVRQLAFDVETRDEQLKELGPGVRRGSYIVGMALGTDDGRRWYLPMRHEGGGNLDPDMVWAWARSELNAFDGDLVGANLLYDLDYSSEQGLTFPRVKRFLDVQVAEPLLDEHRLSYALSVLAKDYLHDEKREQLLKEAAVAYGFGTTPSEVKGNLWRLPAKYVGAYGEADADLPLRILPLQLKKLENEGLLDLFDLESRLIPVLLAMRRRGVRVNVGKAEEVRFKLVAERDQALAKVRHLAGPKAELMAPESFVAALRQRGLHVPTTPKSNKPSITKGWLQENAGDALVDAIIQGRRVNTIITTFIDGHILTHAINGRIHCEFNQLKNDDGGTIARFCVSGDTVLNLSCGDVKIKDYTPTGYDTILTHRGRQRKILRKFYKGKEDMFKISLDNGATITCTKSHIILSADGWRSICDLQIGSLVFTNGSSKGICGERSDFFESCGALSTRRQTDSADGCYGVQYNTSKCVVYTGTRSSSGQIQIGEGAALFTQQNGRSQSNEGQEWGTPSQLYRGHLGWSRLSSEEGEREIHVCSSYSDVRVVRHSKDTYWYGSSSYRQEPIEQRSRQSCIDDDYSPPQDTCPYGLSRIKEIRSVGRMEVWDVEVDEDSSYCAGGLVHHNSSSNPNLQNLPSRDDILGPLIRSLFLPEENHRWARADFSQIEYRFLTHYAFGDRSEEARNLYRNDPKTDFHNMCAKMLGFNASSKGNRTRIKSTNFCKVYGGGIPKIAATIGITIEEATEFVNQYDRDLPFVKKTGEIATMRANERGFITTIYGRRQRFNLWEPYGNYTRIHTPLPYDEAKERYGSRITRAFTYAALNRVLQGSAADQMKKAMVDVWESGICDSDILGAPLVTVHDELDVSAPETPAGEEALMEMKRLMEEAITLKVPVIAELERGPSWGECH
jgi:DNA polymerase I-like protein with 3'-5' exonuclease and polymerase domains